ERTERFTSILRPAESGSRFCDAQRDAKHLNGRSPSSCVAAGTLEKRFIQREQYSIETFIFYFHLSPNIDVPQLVPGLCVWFSINPSAKTAAISWDSQWDLN